MTCSRHPKRAQSRASRLLWLFGTSRAREGLLASQRGVSPLVRPGALSPVQGLRPTPGRRRKARSASGLLVWPVAWPRLLGGYSSGHRSFLHWKEGFPKRLLAGRSARIVVTMGMPVLLYGAYRSTINARSNVRCWHLADIAADAEHVRFRGEADITDARSIVR